MKKKQAKRQAIIDIMKDKDFNQHPDFFSCLQKNFRNKHYIAKS